MIHVPHLNFMFHCITGATVCRCQNFIYIIMIILNPTTRYNDNIFKNAHFCKSLQFNQAIHASTFMIDDNYNDCYESLRAVVG